MTFSKPDRTTAKYGVAFSQGSSANRSPEVSISNITDDPGNFYRESWFDFKAWLGVRELSESLGVSENSAVASLLPSTTWVGYGNGQVARNDPSAPPAAIVDMNAGAGWKWGSAYMTAGVWRSSQSGPQLVSTLSTSSVSDGTDFNVGVYEKKWSANAYVAASHGSYDDGLNNSSYYNTSAGGSFTFILQQLPDLTLGLDVSRYGNNYLSLGGIDNSHSTTAGVAFDFSKYLSAPDRQKLQLFYYARDERYESQWASIQSLRTQRLRMYLVESYALGGNVAGSWRNS